MSITMSLDNRDSVLNMILVAATRQRDIPKFTEWVRSLSDQIIVNDAHSAVAGPVTIDDYLGGNRIDFNVDPYWGPGTVFLINGSARNDGLFTVSRKIRQVSVGPIEFDAAVNKISFSVDPDWVVGTSFTIAGSTSNNHLFTIVTVIQPGMYIVSGASVVEDESSVVAVATDADIIYEVIETIDTTNLSIPFSVTDFTTPNIIELDNTVPDPDWLAGATIVISGADWLVGNAINGVTTDHVEFVLAPNPVLGVGFQFTATEDLWTTPIINWLTGNTIQVNPIYVDLPVAYTFSVTGEDRSNDVVDYFNGVVKTIALVAGGDGYHVGDVLTIVQAAAVGGTATISGITTTDATTASFTAPSTITFAVDPGIAHPLCWGAGQTFRIVAAANPTNNQTFTIVSNVGVAYAVTAVNITTNGADAVTATPLAGVAAVIALTTGGYDYTSPGVGLATTVAPVNGVGATITISAVKKEIELDVDPGYLVGTRFVTANSTTAANDQTYTVVANVGVVYEVTGGAVVTEAGAPTTVAEITLDQTYTVVSNAVAGQIVVTPAFFVGASLVGQGGAAGRAAVSQVYTVVGNVGAIYEVTPNPALKLPNEGHVSATRDGSYVISAHVPGSWVYTLAAAAWSTQVAPAATEVVSGANGVATTTIASMSEPGGLWFWQKFLPWIYQGNFSNQMLAEIGHYYGEEFWTAPIDSFNLYGTIQLDSDPVIGLGHIVQIDGSTSNDGDYTMGAKVNYVSTGNITFTAAGKHVVFATDPATITPPRLWVSGMQFTITGSLIAAPNNNQTFTIDNAAAAPDYTVLETVYNEGPIAAVAHALGVTYDIYKNASVVLPIIDFRAANVIRFAPNPNLDVDSLVYVHNSTTNDGGYTVSAVTAVVATFAAADNSITFSAALDPHTVNPTVWVPGAIIEVSGTALNDYAFTIVSYSAGAHKFIVTGPALIQNEASATAVLLCAGVYAHTDYTMHEVVVVEVAPIGCYGQEAYSVQIVDFKAANVIEFLFDPHFAALTVIEVLNSTSNDGIYSVHSNAGVDYTMHETVAVEAALLTSVGVKKFVAEVGAGEIRSF